MLAAAATWNDAGTAAREPCPWPTRYGGYATEASQALFVKAQQTYAGELLAIIAPENLASQNVWRKLGFTFWSKHSPG